MEIFRSKEEIENYVKKARDNGHTVAFAPTMGALHAGHLSLIDKANESADISIASIFVNPKQFAPNEDFDTYPRTEEEDIELLKKRSCAAVFIPSATEVYAEGEVEDIVVKNHADILCGMTRPHFFHGVATVVIRLLDLVKPDIAIFGEKDWQQLQIIKQVVAQRDLKIKIIGAEIVREPDGLAMSSRNKYLSEAERKIAAKLFAVINEVKQKVNNGEKIYYTLQDAKNNLLESGFNEIDYLEIRDENNFKLYGAESSLNERKKYYDNNIVSSEISTLKNLRIFAAAILGQTRLIDNLSASTR